jgi:DNA topoisomerase-1
VYELVSRRFLATLAEDAKSESVRADVDLNGEPFKANGYRVIEPNWKFLYPYAAGADHELPPLAKGDELLVREVRLLDKETKPPSRYSQGSLIQEMERLSLGTKSTRHEIIQKLFYRNYVVGNPPVPTNVGYAVTDALENHADVIAKPEMTATLEKDMDLIAEGKKTLQEVVQESRDLLERAYGVLEKNREPIGEAVRVALREENKLGKCPTCKEGDLMVRIASRSRKRFVGCSAYPNCNQTYPLPQRGGLRPLNETCTFCAAPRVRILNAGRRPWDLCVNFTCPSKTQKPAPGQAVAVKTGGEHEEVPPPADVDEGSEEEAQ